MSQPRPPTRLPLDLIEVRCSVCGGEVKAIEVNRDKARFHSGSGALVRFPRGGLTEAEIAELKATLLRCECCQEDHEEAQGCC